MRLAGAMQCAGYLAPGGQQRQMGVTADGISIGMNSPWRTVVILVSVLALALLVWAWLDGGREPVREMAEPVAVPHDAGPESAK